MIKGNVLAVCFTQTSPKGEMLLARQKLQEDVENPAVWETFRCQVSHGATEGYFGIFSKSRSVCAYCAAAVSPQLVPERSLNH